MNKVLNGGNIRKVIRKSVPVLLIVAILAGSIVSYNFNSKSKAHNSDNEVTKEMILDAVRKKREEVMGKSLNSVSKGDSSSNDKADTNEEIRTIIELKSNSVVEDLCEETGSAETKTDYFEYDKLDVKCEEKARNKKKDIIKQIEKITGNKILNQSEYLANTITIEATTKEIEKIEKLSEVASVYETSSYESQVENSTSKTGVNYVREQEEYAYKGDETVVAIVDTGVNVNHPDMKLDDDARVKYTKEEWKEKIDLLGYGQYYTDKIPFGYNYMNSNNEILSSSKDYHGYHVAGIVGANGGIKGVAPNTQLIGLTTLGGFGGGHTDQLVRSIEDAVKLGADVINMSLGSKNGLTTEEDYTQKAIDAASKAGVFVCVSAGNDGTCEGYGGASNCWNMTDTATLGSPGTAKSCLTVAAADISKIDGVENENMAHFTSWGPGNDLTIKPEITAPGVNIISTWDGEDYGSLDGTSMSTPFVSGCATLVINDIKKNNVSLDGTVLMGSELTKYIKADLMNTSEPMIDNSNYDGAMQIPYSIRRQGAGMVNAKKAIENKVIATYNEQAKIELGELETGSTEFEIVLTNYGDKEAKYSLEASDVYRNIKDDKTCAIINDSAANISFEESSITVPAKESVKVKAYINISSEYAENSFVEAYVRFKGDGVVDLSMPLLGFYGSWVAEPLIDYPIYDENQSYLESIGATNCLGGEERPLESGTGLLGYDKTYNDGYLGMICDGSKMEYKSHLCAISPDDNGIRDNASVAVTNIRNIKELKMSVLDADKRKIRTVGIANDIRRKSYLELCENNYEKLEYLYSTVGDQLVWDGKLYDKSKGEYVNAEDGQYYIELEAKISHDFEPQNITMPIKIDTKAPTITDMYTTDNNELCFKVEDDLEMDCYYYLYENFGAEAYMYCELEQNEQGYYILPMEKSLQNEVWLIVTDIAGNEVVKKFDFNDENSNNEYQKPNSELSDEVIDDYRIKIDVDESICEEISEYECNNSMAVLLKDMETTTFEFDVKPIEGYTIDSVECEVPKRLNDTEEEYEELDPLSQEYNDRYGNVTIKGTSNGDGTYHIKLDNTVDWNYINIYTSSNTGSNYNMVMFVYENSRVEDYHLYIVDNEEMSLYGDMKDNIINDDMLNDDGTYTFKGNMSIIPNKLIINGQEVSVDETTKEFQIDLKLLGGVNKIKISVDNQYRSYELERELIYSKFNVKLEGIDDETKTIKCRERTFNLKGTIESYINGYVIKINEDLVYSSTTYYNIEAGRGEIDMKDFAYDVELKDGVNEIVLSVSNHIGEIIIKKLYVEKI